ncbi:MAG: uracil-DNA glycosylase [Spirochaetales bacterium]|nr:uracil-DNA glycosylase [Spirochaetales bacterium]
MDVRIEESWKTKLRAEFESSFFAALTDFVKAEYKKVTVYPPGRDIFRAFDLCPFPAVKVVILGQDPYHGPGQANGLCFSVGTGVDFPPSLVNIFQEIRQDLGREPTTDQTLESWARQGVLLLNSTLTVRAGAPTSHAGRGWEEFTDRVLAILGQEKENLVFMLWGAYAQRKGAFLDEKKHLVLKSPHPSPLSAYRGFFGSKPFSRANAYLESHAKTPIDW